MMDALEHRPLTPFLGLVDEDEEDPILHALQRRLANETQLSQSRLAARSFNSLQAEIEPRLLTPAELRALHRVSRPSTATTYRSPLQRSISSASSMRGGREHAKTRAPFDSHFSTGIMAMQRKHQKLPALRAGASWRAPAVLDPYTTSELRPRVPSLPFADAKVAESVPSFSAGDLRTDIPWVSTVPNQLDPRCEALRHASKLLPKGQTAVERKAKARRWASSPLRESRGPARYAQPEASRHALANSMAPAHDLLFRKASMPVARSMLDR